MPSLLAQTATPPPTPVGVGPEGLAEYWPALVRGAWFLAGFLVVVILGWLVVEPLVTRAIRRRNRNNPTLEEAVSRYVRLLVLVVAFFVAAGIAGYGGFVSDSAIVVAAATLAIGVAGQTVLGSLVSGLVLVTDPEFNVGNYIQWEDNEGTVRSITLRVTRVRTPDGELVTVPNTTLTEDAITRPFRQGRFRLVESIGLDYDADLGVALEHLTAAAEAVDDIESEPTPKAYVEEFGDNAVIVRVYYWVDDPRQEDVLRIRSTYMRAINRRFDDAGIEINPPPVHELQGRVEVGEQ